VIVHLWGVIQSEEERRAICVAAQNEDDLARMVGDKMSRLSAGARVRDYIQVIAIKRVTDKVRQSASHNRADGNHHAREV
jgi:hypothetical protein